MYLHIQTNKGYEQPMRVISNSKKIDTDEYKKRWEIETIFKTMKQEFKMEKIQAGSLQVLNNMVSIIMLAVALSKSIYDVNSDFK
ncbi:MAG: transposase [Candidatus Pacebacteria bacterium]|nr:transposase [Candidatus Paceibacterota bacterium]